MRVGIPTALIRTVGILTHVVLSALCVVVFCHSNNFCLLDLIRRLNTSRVDMIAASVAKGFYYSLGLVVLICWTSIDGTIHNCIGEGNHRVAAQRKSGGGKLKMLVFTAPPGTGKFSWSMFLWNNSFFGRI